MDLVPYCPDDVIDSAGLRARGLTSHDVTRLCRAGRLHHLVRGWFATRPPGDAVDRHLLTARALTTHFDGRAVPSPHSRLLAVGLPVWRADLSVVHLTRVQHRGSRRREGFTVHPAVDRLGAVAGPQRAGVPVAVAIVQTGILNDPMDALIAATKRLHAGSMSGQTRSRCSAGRSQSRLPTRPARVWLSTGLRLVGHRDEAWLKRGLPSS